MTKTIEIVNGDYILDLTKYDELDFCVILPSWSNELELTALKPNTKIQVVSKSKSIAKVKVFLSSVGDNILTLDNIHTGSNIFIFGNCDLILKNTSVSTFFVYGKFLIINMINSKIIFLKRCILGSTIHKHTDSYSDIKFDSIDGITNKDNNTAFFEKNAMFLNFKNLFYTHHPLQDTRIKNILSEDITKYLF